MTLSNALKVVVFPTDSWIPVTGEDPGLGLDESEVTSLQPPACQRRGAGQGGKGAGQGARDAGQGGRGAVQGCRTGVQGSRAEWLGCRLPVGQEEGRTHCTPLFCLHMPSGREGCEGCLCPPLYKHRQEGRGGEEGLGVSWLCPRVFLKSPTSQGQLRSRAAAGTPRHCPRVANPVGVTQSHTCKRQPLSHALGGGCQKPSRSPA